MEYFRVLGVYRIIILQGEWKLCPMNCAQTAYSSSALHYTAQLWHYIHHSIGSEDVVLWCSVI